MRLFNSFKKQNYNSLKAEVSGKLLPMESIPDEVFSQGLMGPCCAIKPDSGDIRSPMDGIIGQLSETLHAVCIQGKDNSEILIHLGVDTVKLKGDGFKSFVKEGQKVSAGDKLIEMDLAKIKEASLSPVIITLVSNPDDLGEVVFTEKETITLGEEIIQIHKKN